MFGLYRISVYLRFGLDRFHCISFSVDHMPSYLQCDRIFMLKVTPYSVITEQLLKVALNTITLTKPLSLRACFPFLIIW